MDSVQWSEQLVLFQNQAERAFNERKTPSTLLRYLLAVGIFILSTLWASFRYPFAVLSKRIFSRPLSNPINEGKVGVVTDSTVTEVLQRHQRVVLEFSADWCGPCLLMQPFIEAFAQEQTTIYVGKVDADQNASLLKSYQVRGLPQLILFEQGQEIKRHGGALTTQELREWAGVPLNRNSAVMTAK